MYPLDMVERMSKRSMNDAYTLRLPDGWRIALKVAAARNGRSMNSEIIQRLKPTIEVEATAEMATGAEFGDATPAAENDEAASGAAPSNIQRWEPSNA